MLNKIVYACGMMFIFIIVYFIGAILYTYIKRLINKQTKVKCLCRHEYEPNNAFYCFGGIDYEFKCRKCGKVVSVKTVVDDTFKWTDRE